MKNLDEFLTGEAGQAEADLPSAAVTETTPPVADATSDADGKLVADPKAADEADDGHPAPDDVVGLKSALQAERARRRDYKGERDRLAGEMAALKAQMEEARKAPAAPVPPPQVAQQPVAIPNPIEDPEGWHLWQERQRFSDKLDISEDRLREQIGDDADVDAKIAKFKELAAANPALAAELKQHRHPYKFAYDYVKKTTAMEEIGDPAKYREKLEAEIRAKVEAEYAGTAPPAPKVNLPQSLGTARSAGSRSAPVYNVAEDFSDILRPATRR